MSCKLVMSLKRAFKKDWNTRKCGVKTHIRISQLTEWGGSLEIHLAASSHSGIIREAGGIGTKASAGKGAEDGAAMSTVVAVAVSKLPSITSLHESRVAGLKSQRVDEEAHEHDVALETVGVGQLVS